MSTGLIHNPILPSQILLGSVNSHKENRKVLLEDGRWDKVVIDNEKQYAGELSAKIWDSNGCTNFAFNNIIEKLVKVKYGLDWNLSDSFQGWSAENSKEGNYLYSNPRAFNKNGFLFESEWGFPKKDRNGDGKYSWSDYMTKPSEDLLELAKSRTEEWEVIYYWVPIQTPEEKERELQFAPLYIAGSFPSNKRMVAGIYQNSNTPRDFGHSWVIEAYLRGQYMMSLDSYPPYHKKLSLDYVIGNYSLYIDIIKKEKDMVKPNIEEKMIVDKPENTREVGLFLNGNIVVYKDVQSLLLEALSIHNGSLKGKFIHLSQKQWDMFDKVSPKKK